MKRMIAILLLIVLSVSFFSMLGFCGCSEDDVGACEACGQIGRSHVILVHDRVYHICSDCVRRVRAGEDIGL